MAGFWEEAEVPEKATDAVLFIDGVVETGLPRAVILSARDNCRRGFLALWFVGVDGDV